MIAYAFFIPWLLSYHGLSQGGKQCQTYQKDICLPVKRVESCCKRSHPEEQHSINPPAVPSLPHAHCWRIFPSPRLTVRTLSNNFLGHESRGPSPRGSSRVFSGQSPSYLADSNKNKVDKQKSYENKYGWPLCSGWFGLTGRIMLIIFP